MQKLLIDGKNILSGRISISGSKKLIVHLDADHSERNVLKELELYSKIMSKGSYLICGDTHVEFFKQNPHGENKNYFKSF